MGNVGLRQESPSAHGFHPGVEGKLCSVSSVLVCANGGGKGPELGFWKAAFCMFLCSYSLSCWPRAQPILRICVCVEHVWALTLLTERADVLHFPLPLCPILCSQNETLVQSGTLH